MDARSSVWLRERARLVCEAEFWSAALLRDGLAYHGSVCCRCCMRTFVSVDALDRHLGALGRRRRHGSAW
jgi:hypothetical protein